MQPQFILSSVLVGLAAAIVQDVDNEDRPKLYCKAGEGSVIQSSRGPVCIGVKGEDFGPAKECAIAICLRAGFCDELVKDENGCMVCPPGCGVGGKPDEEDACPPVVCNKLPGCESIMGANGCKVCPPGC
ncbi:hypothetical protein G3M48_009114 [Beauveria asiatica]|uniref:Uncharacterized protein n=1 Tax=Beauveria asiatica TaxID=1069075 RepID=A0AAW0S3G0_9HYPO